MEDEAWSAADGWEDDDWLRPVRSGVPYVSEKKKKHIVNLDHLASIRAEQFTFGWLQWFVGT